MSHKFLLDVKFHSFLIQCDQDLASEVQQKGCPHCGGALHQADYPRSPLGMFVQFRDLYSSRRGKNTLYKHLFGFTFVDCFF